jgi:transposase-like protein
MVNIQDLIDDAKCYETVRTIRWPDGVSCPHCSSAAVIKDGRDDTQPHRQRYQCHCCRRRFDDLTGTIFAGHHRPLRTWITCLYLMGLNLSGLQIAKELDMNKDDARAMIQQLRQGIVDRRPPVALSGTVECDEVYVVAGHKGHPEAVKKREGRATPTPEGGSRAGDAGEGEAADLRDVAARRRGRDPDVGERQAGDDRPLDRSDDS